MKKLFLKLFYEAIYRFIIYRINIIQTSLKDNKEYVEGYSAAMNEVKNYIDYLQDKLEENKRR